MLTYLQIENLPIPPTINSAYVNLNRSGFKGRCKSSKYILFDLAFRRSIFGTKRPQIPVDAKIELHLEFCFQSKNLYTKDNRIKRNDVSNRIKIIEDSLAAYFGFNDCQVFKVIAEKKSIPDNLPECCNATIIF